MAGYFHYYPKERVQILGKTELTFMETLRERNGRPYRALM